MFDPLDLVTCMVSGLSRDKAESMNESDNSEEPQPTPWPKQNREKQHDPWPAELDEDTWGREASEAMNEE
mgnify:CR=1 FL=1